MRRPGPLQELPIEQFYSSTPNLPHLTSVKPIRSNKRPLSPGEPILFSPAKRRILNAEGIFSPEKIFKSSLPSLTDKLASPARFSDVLAGPASPARVLHFGLPKNAGGDPQKRSLSDTLALDATPTQSSSTTKRLAPSPELKSRSVRPTRNNHSLDADAESDGIASFDVVSHSSSSPSDCIISFVPRDLPPQSQPHSIHYPGFLVFQDPHIVVFPPVINENPSFDMNVDQHFHKENLPPRRNARKTATATSDPEVYKVPDAVSLKKSKSSNDASKRTIWSDASNSAPSADILGGRGGILSPLSTTLEGKRGSRQVMKDELDVGQDVDD